MPAFDLFSPPELSQGMHALLMAGMILTSIAGIWFLIAAFRESAGWGLACIFLPFASLIFLILHWREAWKPFALSIVGVALYIAPVFSVLAGAGGAMGEMLAQMQSELEQSAPALAAAAQQEPLPAEGPLDTVTAEDGTIIGVGTPVDEAVAALGYPKARLATANELVLKYSGFTLLSDDLETVTRIEAAPVYDTERQARKAARGAAPRQVDAVAVVSRSGNQVALNSLLVPGKVTVVDFFAEWCGPCRGMGSALESIARRDSEVVLRKVDIVRWGTPVTQQYGINSVPNVRVYDRGGNQVGSPSHNLAEVEMYIAQAK